MKINVETNSSFKEVHQSKHKIIAMKGSAGSGKSVDTAQQYIIRLLADKGRNLLCIRKAEVTNRDSTFAELQSAVHRMGIPAGLIKFTENPMRARFANGNTILFRGVNNAKEQEKIKSINVPNGKITDIWVEEATELTRENVDILEDRLRGVLPDGLFYQMKLTFNPVSSAHWIKSSYFDIQSNDVMTHHSTYVDNRFIDKGYAERMERRKILDPMGYRIYGLGEWGELKGLIFEEGTNWFVGNDFEEGDQLGMSKDGEVKVSQELEYYDKISMGVDFGYSHAFAWFIYGMKGDDLYVIRELYKHEKTTADMIGLAKAMGFPTKYNTWCDSAEPDRIEELQRAGYMARGVSKEKGSVNAQIDWLKSRRIFVHHSCVNMIKELQQWKWKYNDQLDIPLDVPVDIFDDAIASMRYGIEEWRKQTEIKILNLDEAMYGEKIFVDEDGIMSDMKFDDEIL